MSFQSLFRELRRRHVFKVALVYGGVAWLLAQMADTVFPALGLAPWTITFVVALLFLGFPLALVLAWAYDITPAGVQRTPPAREERQPWHPPREPTLAPAPEKPAARTQRPQQSIAALPFANLSRDASDDYFSDGLTEELIGALTRVEGLRVAARTSAFSFKGSGLDVREIGRRLEVKHVLEGSVRTAGKRLRMSVQLIDVDDGYCTWSETFDRELDDVFRIQQEIARAVVGRLSTGRVLAPAGAPGYAAAAAPAMSSGPAAIGLFAQPTASLEAFQLYLKGRYFWNRRTEADLRRAIDHFRQAIDIDPGYAVAHAGLADAYAILLDHGIISPQEALPAARTAADRALQLDADLAEAHTSAALVRQFEWNWNAAEDAFREALRRNSGYATAHHRYALFLAWMGRSDEALAQIEEARRLDPVSLIIQSTIGWVLYYAHRFENAEARLRSTLEMDPRFANANVALGLVSLARQNPAEAIAALESALAEAGGSTPILAILGFAYGAAGRTENAHAIIDQLQARSATGYVSAYYRAVPHLGMGENAHALDWLERGLQERSASMVYLQADPLWDPLRADPRFRRALDVMAFL